MALHDRRALLSDPGDPVHIDEIYIYTSKLFILHYFNDRAVLAMVTAMNLRSSPAPAPEST